MDQRFHDAVQRLLRAARLFRKLPTRVAVLASFLGDDDRSPYENGMAALRIQSEELNAALAGVEDLMDERSSLTGKYRAPEAVVMPDYGFLPAGLVGTATSERGAQEEALKRKRRESRRFKAACGAMQVMIWTLDGTNLDGQPVGVAGPLVAKSAVMWADALLAELESK